MILWSSLFHYQTPLSERQRQAMLRCSVGIVMTCVGCYSIFIAWRILLIHNVTLPPIIFYNIKYIKVFAEHILLSFNSAVNPVIYIINNRSIKRKLALQSMNNSRIYRSGNLLKTNRNIEQPIESVCWNIEQPLDSQCWNMDIEQPLCTRISVLKHGAATRIRLVLEINSLSQRVSWFGYVFLKFFSSWSWLNRN